MRALYLTVKAFGPFKNKQTIDFSQLGSETIFLVTGPTGAGKTTIFDAMCFALYGKASGTDRDQDTLKSHFAGEEETTFVEFTFLLRGKQYRIERMPKQRQKKERGEGFKEEPTRAYLYQLQNGEERLVASKIKEVNEMIEELLRLDYDQFRKMIMIPQGEFRKLISENSREREEILQKIFNTQFYSNLTEYLRGQQKSLKKDMEQFEWKIEQEIEKIQWPSQEEEEIPEDPKQVILQLDRTLEQQQYHIKSLKERMDELRKQLNQEQEKYYHAKSIDSLFKEKDGKTAERALIKEQQTEIDQSSHQLHLAVEAQKIVPIERQMNERNQEKERLAHSFKENTKVLNELNNHFQSLKEKYEREKANEQLRDQLKESVRQKKEAEVKLEALLNLKQSVQEIERKQTGARETFTRISNKKKQLTAERETCSELASKERGTTSVLYELKQMNEQLKRSRTNLQRLEKEWNTLQNLRKKYKELYNKTEKAKERSVTLKKHYEAEVDKLKEHRAYHLAVDLSSGQKCPVCGSADHPSLAVQPKDVLSTREMEALKADYDHYEKEYFNLHESMASAKAEGSSHKQLVDTLHEEVRELTGDELSSSAINQAIRKVQDDLKVNIEELQKKEAELKNIRKAADQITQIDDQLNEIVQEVEHLNEQQRKWSEEKVACQTEIHNLEANYNFDTLELKEMKAFVRESEQKLQEAVHSWEVIQEEYRKKSEEMQKLTAKKAELERYLQNAEETCRKKEKEFNQTLDQLRFESFTAYKEALLPEEDINNLTKKIEEFNQRKAVINNRLEELAEKLQEERRPNLEELRLKFEERRELVESKQKELHDYRLVYEQNQNILLSMSSLMEEQKEFAERYYDLAEISNLARGDNSLKLSLERYVLASYLDEILIQANIRLDQMTDHRYQLLRSDALARRGAQSGLELEVIDHHTGQQRSVRTLSGGEGFKASLSLALGMADVVQSHSGGVQLETLFIDEGFGTLDEQSLEQAIGCLRTLQDGNRMLGIISHVQQLKEEIPAKLQIQSSPEGSTIKMAFQ
ncbi:AAA family ATPase [Halobacillus sp. A5]|uniref:AAA family ATPase n=1 Tax=Halobacillus sp. A5 TaxID=2880263 RepID=UPI0020A67087|nr:AAA family ATPase [Halobacillus sp. A5]MCP3025916.1 AAA family ATPase [Halobacillus sp. A5]